MGSFGTAWWVGGTVQCVRRYRMRNSTEWSPGRSPKSVSGGGGGGRSVWTSILRSGSSQRGLVRVASGGREHDRWEAVEQHAVDTCSRACSKPVLLVLSCRGSEPTRHAWSHVPVMALMVSSYNAVVLSCSCESSGAPLLRPITRGHSRGQPSKPGPVLPS